MNLFGIVIATLVAGVGSVWLAALVLRVATRSKLVSDRRYLLSLAAGALLATAFMHLLPEAFESEARPAVLFGVLLAGLVVFFLLDKVELWHHGHEHAHVHAPPAPDARDARDAHHHEHEHGHAHGHGHTHDRTGGAWAVLAGDSLHCFGDGVVIASAFAADPVLGMVATLAVLAHEVPHHIGDLVVLNAGQGAPRAAIVKLSLAGLVTVLGGLIGWWLLDRLQDWLPYFLVAASSSFVYVALADLIPQLQIRMTKTQTAAQVSWLVVGIAVVTLVSQLAHGGHDHAHGRGGAASHGARGAHVPNGSHGSDETHEGHAEHEGHQGHEGHEGHDHGAAQARPPASGPAFK